MIRRLRSMVTAAITPPEPEAPAFDPWAEFQGRVAAARKAAQDRHDVIRDINASQQKTLHAALKAGVQKQGA